MQQDQIITNVPVNLDIKEIISLAGNTSITWMSGKHIKAETSMPNRISTIPSAVICVRSKDGWCELLDQHNTAYRDMMATKCGHIVVFPMGIKRRKPTCNECKKADNL